MVTVDRRMVRLLKSESDWCERIVRLVGKESLDISKSMLRVLFLGGQSLYGSRKQSVGDGKSFPPQKEHSV